MKILKKQKERYKRTKCETKKQIRNMKSRKIQNYKQRNAISMNTASHENVNSFKAGKL